MADPVRLRTRAPGDDAFIYSSWLKSYRQSPAAKEFSNDVYYSGQSRLIARLMKEATILLACSQDDEDQVYGYICFGPGLLHYLYVKHAYRGYGIARLLTERVTTGPLEYTHLVPAFCAKLPEGSRFNPWGVL